MYKRQNFKQILKNFSAYWYNMISVLIVTTIELNLCQVNFILSIDRRVVLRREHRVIMYYIFIMRRRKAYRLPHLP